MSPRDATLLAMEQVSGPVIAVGLVLSAVFVPCAFISGITGQFFRQFAVTIAVSTIISAFNSLTLSPALTALLLRPQNKGQAPPLPRVAFLVAGAALGWIFLGPVATPWFGRAAHVLQAFVTSRPWYPSVVPWSATIAATIVGGAVGWLTGNLFNAILRSFFRLFNAGFARVTRHYTRLVGGLLRVSAIVLVVYGGLMGLTYWELTSTPKGFIPQQDMGYLMCSVQLPDAASKERTEAVMKRLVDIARQDARRLARDGRHRAVVRAQRLRLELRFDVRQPERLLDAPRRLASRPTRLPSTCGKNSPRSQEAQIAVFGPPPVRGVGRAGGFTMMVEDRGDVGPASAAGRDRQSRPRRATRRAA